MSNLLKDNKKLMIEYNYPKNKNINLDSLTLGSGKKIWWKCSKGHEWQAAVYSRKKSGCPVCMGRMVLQGYNDLATQNPELLSEWDYEANIVNGINPNEVLPGSPKKVWWKCPNGHSYMSEIRSRAIYGYGCKYCAGHGTVVGENDLESTNPKLLKEWDYEKNSINPREVSAHSEKRVWWKCPNGHSYKASVGNRNHNINPTGCPYCSNQRILKGFNDLATQNPELLSEWNYEKNTIKPDEIVCGSNKKIWWKCSNGHSYLSSPAARSNGNGCPYCKNKKVLVGYNDLNTTHPNLANEWNLKKNKNIKPNMFVAGSNKKVWWKCKKGHEWQATISSRVRGTNCPICSNGLHTSFPEQAIYYYLNIIFKNVDNRFILDEKYEYDIYIKDINTLIEYDGLYYHNNKKKNEYDLEKERYATEKGFIFYRIKESKNSEYITSIQDNVFKYYPDRSRRLEELIKLIIKELKIDSSISINIIRDYINIENMINKIALDNSLFNLYPEIASEWNYEKNHNIEPKNYLPRSGKIVWWKCKNGHEWKTRICDRIKNQKKVDCPYCSNKQVLEGFNDLATKNPKLLSEWDYKKNSKVKPTSILYNSWKKVWWKCPNGHSYQKEIIKKENSNDCPFCNNRKVLKGYNDFKTSNPILAKEWDYKKNNISPDSIIIADNIKIWWKCSNCNSSYQKTIYNRKRNSKCPNCGFDILKNKCRINS